MELQEIKAGPMRRHFDVKREAVDAEARTVELAFASELPYERWFGIEILTVDRSAVRLGRLESGAPLLWNHNPDEQIGVVESVDIGADRVARARVRFGNSARAREVFDDVKDGIRRNVSVGYRIHEMETKAKPEKGEIDEWRVTDWEPFEVSIVSVPADPTVGIGRSDGADERVINIRGATLQPKEIQMDQQNRAPEGVQVPDSGAVIVSERARASDILELGKRWAMPEEAAKAVQEGMTVGAFQSRILSLVEQRQAAASKGAEIGMSDKEVRSFSFLRAINALANPTDRAAQQAAAFEFEASEAQAKKLGRASRGLTLPQDVVQRDLTTSTATSTSKAGNLIQTDLLSGSFIDVLRNAMILPRLGATFLTGLQGNVDIPKKTVASTAYWVAEQTAPTEGAITFGKVSMSPNTLGAYVDYSRRLMLQSSLDIEALVRNDLATSIAVELDRVALAGTGTNVPTGVLYQSGIGSVTLGTNGGAPTWAMIVNLVREVAIDNALNGALAFVTNPKVVAKMRQTPRQSSGVEGNFLLEEEMSLLGYPVVVSNQIPSNLTKGSASGVCSAMMFGNWRDLMVGMWSGIDLMVDPYTGSNKGDVRVVAFVDTDCDVRYAESFAECNEITTT